MSRVNRVSLSAVGFLAALVSLSSASGAGNPARVTCDPGLEAPADRALSYRHRGDRCEGVYALKVSSTKLRVGSFTARFDSYDPLGGEALGLAWPVPPGVRGPVRLRAYSLNPRTYYRMDSAVAPGVGLFHWEPDLLGALDLRRPDLGVVAWTTAPECEGTELYLPLQIRQGDSGPAPARSSPPGYQVVVVPGEKLRELYVEVAPVADDGRLGAPALRGQPLGYGFYPPREPVLLTLDRPASSGIYRVSLTASFHRGGSTSESFCFYHRQE